MDIWFRLACAAVGIAFVWSLRLDLAGLRLRDMMRTDPKVLLCVALPAALVLVASIAIAITGGHLGAALGLGMAGAIGLLAVVAWHIRH